MGFRLYFNFGSNSEFLGVLLVSLFKALTSYVTEQISYDIEKEGSNWDIICGDIELLPPNFMQIRHIITKTAGHNILIFLPSSPHHLSPGHTAEC